MNRTILSLLLCALATARLHAMQVELNIRADDMPLAVYVNEQSYTLAKCHEVGNESKDTTSVMVDIEPGVNTIAVQVRNKGWMGGLCATILLPSGDTVRTDGSWKYTYATQPQDWYTAGFDDSPWANAQVISDVEDFIGFPKSGVAWANLWYHGGKFIWATHTKYFRKTFTADGGSGDFGIRGSGFIYTAYLNGTQVGSSSSFDAIDGIRTLSKPADTYTLNYVNGQNVFALEVTEQIHGSSASQALNAMLKCVAAGKFRSDGNWKVADNAPSGWHSVDFDDSEWASSGTVEGYDPLQDSYSGGMWMWVNDLYFRTQFTWDGTVGTPAPRAARSSSPPQAAVAATEYYTLTGARIAPGARRGRAHAMIIRRTSFVNGQAVTDCVHADATAGR